MPIKKNISFTFGAQLVNTLLGFISSVIITRLLGAEGRGEYTIFLNSTAFAVLFFGFSINSTIPYFINSGKAKTGELLSTIIVFLLGSTVLVYGLLYLLEISGRLHWALPGSIQSVQYKLLFIGIFFTTVLNGVLTAYLTSFKKFKAVSIYTVLFQVLPATLYMLLYFRIIPYNYADPLTTVVVISSIVSFISAVAVVITFIKVLPVRPSKKFIPFILVKQFVFFSSLAYIGNVATFFNYKLDFWVVDEYMGKSQLGIYSLAAQLSQLLWLLPTAMASVLYSYASTCSQQEAVRYTIQLKQIAFYGTFLFAIIGLVLSYFFIPLLYGIEFSGAFNLMMIFFIGVIPFSIPTLLSSLFAAKGNFKVSFIISLIIFIISTTLYFTLIPRYGLVGGAFASAGAYLIGSIISELWFCMEYKVSVFNLFSFRENLLSLKKMKTYFK